MDEVGRRLTTVCAGCLEQRMIKGECGIDLLWNDDETEVRSWMVEEGRWGSAL